MRAGVRAGVEARASWRLRWTRLESMGAELISCALATSSARSPTHAASLEKVSGHAIDLCSYVVVVVVVVVAAAAAAVDDDVVDVEVDYDACAKTCH